MLLTRKRTSESCDFNSFSTALHAFAKYSPSVDCYEWRSSLSDCAVNDEWRACSVANGNYQ